MSKYYLLSPAKLKVKDANGWLELSKDDYLRTLDCLDGSQGRVPQLPDIGGKLAVYNSSEAAKEAAMKASEEDPSRQHVLFEVKLSKQAKKELKAALKRHYKAEGAPFYFYAPYVDITLVKAFLSHVSKDLPSFSINDSNNLQKRLEKRKLPQSRINKSLLLNSFVLLMLTFFTMGFIFAYSGVTAAIAASLIKMGLLQTGGIGMNFGISSSISLLLWDACFISLFAGHKLLKVGQNQFQRFQQRNHAVAESSKPLDLSDELQLRLNGFVDGAAPSERASLSDVALESPPRMYLLYPQNGNTVTTGGLAVATPDATADQGFLARWGWRKAK